MALNQAGGINPHHISNLFATLHHESGPTGYLGRGTHHSIIGALVDSQNTSNIAVIWDEDHDTRVISLLEKMYTENILFKKYKPNFASKPLQTRVQVIGERKGFLSILVGVSGLPDVSSDEGFLLNKGIGENLKTLVEEINKVSQDQNDPWPVDVSFWCLETSRQLNILEDKKGALDFRQTWFSEGLGYPIQNIINDKEAHVQAYLLFLIFQWDLGNLRPMSFEDPRRQIIAALL